MYTSIQFKTFSGAILLTNGIAPWFSPLNSITIIDIERIWYQ